MFATKCSNPLATKPPMGNISVMILSATFLALKHTHTAIHTIALQSTAFEKAAGNVKLTFLLAISNAFAPTI